MLEMSVDGRSEVIPLVYISDTELTFVAPAFPAGEIELLMRLNGTAYVSESTVLNFIGMTSRFVHNVYSLFSQTF